MSEGRPHNRTYRAAFVEYYGTGPYECPYCGEMILDISAAYVHHIDEDPWNNSRENLTVMHPVCHNQAHHIGIRHDEAIKKQISDSMKQAHTEGRHRGWPGKTSEHQRKAGRQGGKKTVMLRYRCNVCGLVTIPGSLGMHFKATGHSGRTKL